MDYKSMLLKLNLVELKTIIRQYMAHVKITVSKKSKEELINHILKHTEFKNNKITIKSHDDLDIETPKSKEPKPKKTEPKPQPKKEEPKPQPKSKEPKPKKTEPKPQPKKEEPKPQPKKAEPKKEKKETKKEEAKKEEVKDFDNLSSEFQKLILLTPIEKIKKVLVDLNYKGRIQTNKILLTLQLLQNFNTFDKLKKIYDYLKKL